jgi:hypothetical protein
MSFADMKRNRASSLEKLSQQLNSVASKGFTDPMKEKYWKPTIDAAGNGFAVIRFLPPPEGEEEPFIKFWDHAFKGPGGWYIQNSLSTIGKEDPVSQLNVRLWNTGVESDKELVRKQKRRLKFHSNILVIKDPGNPDNEGKVFLFAYGKKVFDKLNDLMNPQFEDEQRINPFDFWEGADFRLKIRKVDGYPNYDKSEFSAPSPLFDGDDEKLERVYAKLHTLQAIKDPKNFKSYEELNALLLKALGAGSQTSAGPAKTAENLISADLDIGKYSGTAASPATAKADSSSDDDDDDFDASYFAKLANS